jgi:hypothetical protein
MIRYFTLNPDNSVEPCITSPTTLDMMQWAMWRENNRDRIRVDADYVGPVWISTVFLGMNHAFRDGPPLIFETMSFCDDGDWAESDCERYSTYEEAQAGHRAMVKKYEDLLQVAATKMKEIEDGQKEETDGSRAGD